MPSVTKVFGQQLKTSPALYISQYGSINLTNCVIDISGQEFIDGVYRPIVSENSNISGTPNSIASNMNSEYTMTSNDVTITLRRV
jgi:hypothetical protein